MKRAMIFLASLFCLLSFRPFQNEKEWIRINLLGYKPASVKVAAWCSEENAALNEFELIDQQTGERVYRKKAGKPYGSYGPFAQTYRLNFSDFSIPGTYFIKAGNAESPVFTISDNVYDGAADFCLQYMRQQRSGFNPFLNDSCHVHDGYTLYGPMPDSTHIDVVGGWHDASDYLQYASTSANATYMMLAAYRDFPGVFKDKKQANGLDGSNGMADVIDEAKWGLDWLLKMHPKPDWMFNQVGDDRDHMGMRIPKEDTNFYGKGLERPVYFVTGGPQQRGKFMNATTGTSSTAGKFASAFALGSIIFKKKDFDYSKILLNRSLSAWDFALKKEGVTQTASVRSPYIYAEDNWTDDMELAAADLYAATGGLAWSSASVLYAEGEKVTPWLGSDTANHYQWYPFINIGHYELAKQLKGRERDTIINFYKEGIERVWKIAKQNAFYRGVPFIWCSNNLTTAFAIQCYWYMLLTGDKAFDELEQANFDWLFGCNPWGTSMVYGLPSQGDTPTDPHSAFTHLKHYPINGGLVDGPVYGSIYKNLIGITLYQPDEYAPFQSGLAVYHDDYGDYSTNEPTMDGTATLIYLLAAKETEPDKAKKVIPLTQSEGKKNMFSHGAVIRGDTADKRLALIFSGDEFGEGGSVIAKTLGEQKIKASFFFTGRFYRNPAFHEMILQLKKDKHYLGAHSDKHLLYCSWTNRNSLLVTKKEFLDDLSNNYAELKKYGIPKEKAFYFLPPYEWYNDSISKWTKEWQLQLINYTPGTLTPADYTTPADKNYRNSATIYQSILDFENTERNGLNGFILLAHIGSGPGRQDKFYEHLPDLIKELKEKGYRFVSIDQLLSPF